MRYFITLFSVIPMLGACAPLGSGAGQLQPQLYVNGMTFPAGPQGSIHDNIGNMRDDQGFPTHVYQQEFGHVSAVPYGLGLTYRF